eukprot:1005508-Pyramimonas_sp.AAC.1
MFVNRQTQVVYPQTTPLCQDFERCEPIAALVLGFSQSRDMCARNAIVPPVYSIELRPNFSPVVDDQIRQYLRGPFSQSRTPWALAA